MSNADMPLRKFKTVTKTNVISGAPRYCSLLTKYQDRECSQTTISCVT